MAIRTEETQVDAGVRKAVEKVLRPRLTDVGYAGVDVAAGRDQEGDPVLLIDVRYKAVDRPIDSKATFGLATAVRQELAKVGEVRFPHIRHHFDEHQKIAS